MDIYSKVFLINMVLVISIAWLDKFMNDKISAVVNVEILGFWAFLSILSIPVYVIYLIVTK